VKHYIHVRYEDFLENAEKSLSDLFGRFDIPKNPTYRGVFTTVRGEKAGKAAKATKRYQDHLGSTFKKYSYYVNEEWADTYDVSTMDDITAKLDVKLESRVGYHAPPDDFYKKHRRTVMIRDLTEGKGVLGTVKNATFVWMWWIISRLTILLFILGPISLWLAHSSEANDIVERGDGVTVDAEEDRKKEIEGLNKRKGNTQMPFMNIAGLRGGREAPLAEGWFEAVDFETGQPYYFHRVSREVTWTRPVVRNAAAAAHKKNDDENIPQGDEFDEVAFNDALHQVASEKAMDTLPLNASKHERDSLTREISGKLRQRYIRKAMEQQSQQEEMQRMQNQRFDNDRMMQVSDLRRQDVMQTEQRRQEEIRMRNEWEMVERDKARDANVMSFGEMRRAEEERARSTEEMRRKTLEKERRYELDGELERSEMYENNDYARAQEMLLH